MQIKSKAVSAGMGYTLGNILIKGINFLTVPIFSRMMSTDEFGVYNVFLSYDAILSVLIGMALHSSVKSANIEYKKKIDEYVSSVSLIYILNACICWIIAAIGAHYFSSLLNIPFVAVLLLVAFSTSSAIIQLYNEKISLQYAYKNYLKVAFTNSIGNVFISLVLIKTCFSTHKDIGRIIGATITVLIIALWILFDFYRKSKPKFSKKYWSFGIKYCLPIIPHGIAQTLLGQFDRIMSAQMVSVSAAGIYSLAGNIKLILTVISTSISSSWSTWFYEKIEKGDSREIQMRAGQLVSVFTILTLGLIMISPEMIDVLGGTAYASGKYVAVPMICDAFVLFLYNTIVPSEYYSKKTIYIMLGTSVAAVLNVILNYIFIQVFGFVAAAYTTLAAYIVYLILHLVISKKLMGYFIVTPKVLLLNAFLVFTTSVIGLYFIDNIGARYILGILIEMCVLVKTIYDMKKAR